MSKRLCFKIQMLYFQYKSVVLRVFFGILEFSVGVDPGCIMTSHCNQGFIFLGQFFLVFLAEKQKRQTVTYPRLLMKPVGRAGDRAQIFRICICWIQIS